MVGMSLLRTARPSSLAGTKTAAKAPRCFQSNGKQPTASRSSLLSQGAVSFVTAGTSALLRQSVWTQRRFLSLFRNEGHYVFDNHLVDKKGVGDQLIYSIFKSLEKSSPSIDHTGASRDDLFKGYGYTKSSKIE